MRSLCPLLLSSSLLSIVGVSPALAQDVVSDQATADMTEAATASEGDIVVTGTRIRLQELKGLEPTTSLGNEYLEARNLTSIGDALNELPTFRGSITPRGTQSSYGNGVNFVNTFGIGSNRTLTLINGRRVVSSNLPSLFGPGSPGLQVDLNIIPSILVDRIDTVFIGGAPIYGSDAIAGTVNLIVKDRFKGAEFRAQSGVNEQGDGFRYNLSGVVGRDIFDGRANITAAVSYDDEKGVRGTQRQHIRDNIGVLNNCTGPGAAPANDGRLNPNIPCNNGASDGVPARILFRDLHSPYLSTGGVILDDNTGDFTGLQFGPGGSLIPVADVGNLTGFFGTGGNTYQTSDQTQVTSDLKRFTANLFAHYDLAPAATLYFEGLYYSARARELGTSPSFNSFVFDPDVSGGLSFDTATVPFISEATRQALLDQDVTQFNVSRSNEDLFDQSASSRTDLKRFVGGVRGDFNAIGRELHYDVSVNYGVNRIRNYSQAINQQRFINAVSIGQDVNGAAVCTLTPTIPVAPNQPVQPIADPNCQPLNLFGPNQASQAARDYIVQNTTDLATVRQFVVNANIGGTLFDTWAGPVGFNVGYEHRFEKASFDPDAFNVAGGGRSTPVAPTAGSFRLNEFFGEVVVPLLSPDNNFLIHSIEVFGRVRHVDNSINGKFVAFAAGGKISPFDGLSFRGNYTRSFRAPAITELFLPQSPTFERPLDLCTASAINAGAVPATRAANCTAFLASVNADPATYTLLASQASVAGISGGNLGLENEQANSFTFGGIFEPRFLPGLTITADYIDIRIKNPIVNLTTDDLTSGCFDNTSFNAADPRNGNQFCTALGFGPDGQIPNSPTNPAVRTGFINGQSYTFKGITGNLNYTRPLSGVGLPGSISIGGDALYVLRRIEDNTGVAPQRSDGLVGDPRFSAQARVNFIDTNYGFGVFVNYTGRQLSSVNNRGPNPNDTREFDHYKAYATINTNAFIKTDDDFRFNFSVTNLFNRIGQKYYGFIVPASVNDDIGRRYTVGISKTF